MSIRTSITSRLCNQTNCIGGIYPFFRRKSKSIKTCLFFKPLESRGLKEGLYKPSQIPKYSIVLRLRIQLAMTALGLSLLYRAPSPFSSTFGKRI